LLREEYEVGVHDEQDICEDQQVVGVPEGVEAGQVVPWRRQLDDAPAQGCQSIPGLLINMLAECS